MAQQKGTQLVFMALLSESGIQCCRELWYRLQMGSGIAVVVVQASSCSSDSTPSLGTSVCHGHSPKKQKKKKLKTLITTSVSTHHSSFKGKGGQVCISLKQWESRAGFLHLGTVDPLGWIILCCRELSCALYGV